MRTVATFESDRFNTSQVHDYFINPGCFGNDTCRWLMERLRVQGLATDAEPGQEDFGWYFNFSVPEGEHCCVVAHRPPDAGYPGTWVIWVERNRGLVSSLFGGRKRDISQAALVALHRALGDGDVSNLRWHERARFDSGDEQGGAEQP